MLSEARRPFHPTDSRYHCEPSYSLSSADSGYYREAHHSVSSAPSRYHCKPSYSFSHADSRYHRKRRHSFRPPIPDITSRAGNQPTLNVRPSPPVEVGKPVLFEVVLWQPPPPGWNLQYRFDFGDGSQTDWMSERQATHTYLSSGNGSYPVHVEIASTYRDRVMPAKAIDKDVDVIPPSNPTRSATALRCYHTLATLPSQRRRLLLTLQSPHLFRQRFLPSRRFRPHRRLCGLRECYGSLSPLASPSRGWLLLYTRNGNRKR